ncbi:YozQ family protein [Peribacillus sp. B-H-3]|uniref:YozQ family protein n=1 Tax=Peribacillus sp. B-H-3 TaxID=3400420 RepID=UPI003B01BD72
MEKDNKKQQNSSSEIAGKQFEVEDYKKNDQLSSGLAETHEQVNDDYMAGTIDQKAKSEKEQ